LRSWRETFRGLAPLRDTQSFGLLIFENVE